MCNAGSHLGERKREGEKEEATDIPVGYADTCSTLKWTEEEMNSYLHIVIY